MTPTARELADQALKAALMQNIAERRPLPPHLVPLDVPADTDEELKWLARKTGFLLKETP